MTREEASLRDLLSCMFKHSGNISSIAKTKQTNKT